MALSREQKIAKAGELRGEGWTYADLGERFGVSTTTVYRWLNPAQTAPYRNGRACNPERTRELDREYDRRHPGECPECGGSMTRGTARQGGKCKSCHEDERDRRTRLIVTWWAEGLPQSEIAARLGWTVNHLATEMHFLREDGYDLPYRYRVSRPRFPEQVAA